VTDPRPLVWPQSTLATRRALRSILPWPRRPRCRTKRRARAVSASGGSGRQGSATLTSQPANRHAPSLWPLLKATMPNRSQEWSPGRMGATALAMMALGRLLGSPQSGGQTWRRGCDFDPYSTHTHTHTHTHTERERERERERETESMTRYERPTKNNVCICNRSVAHVRSSTGLSQHLVLSKRRLPGSLLPFVAAPSASRRQSPVAAARADGL
jgi:hypothetical protein